MTALLSFRHIVDHLLGLAWSLIILDMSEKVAFQDASFVRVGDIGTIMGEQVAVQTVVISKDKLGLVY